MVLHILNFDIYCHKWYNQIYAMIIYDHEDSNLLNEYDYLIREIASIYFQKVEYDQLGGGVTHQRRYNKK